VDVVVEMEAEEAAVEEGMSINNTGIFDIKFV
jgi:hypothetical protein